MKKHPLLTLLLIAVSFVLIPAANAQITILGVSDSTAVVGDAFVSQVSVSGTSPSYELLESPSGMTINGSGQINWTPGTITSGGKVTVRSWNGGGSDTYSFNVYVANEVVCPANLLAYYPFDEVNSTTFDDYMDPINVASTLTPVEDVVGKVGMAQRLVPTSASTEFMEVPDNNQWEWLVVDDFSFSFWIKSEGAPAHAGPDDNQVLYSHYRFNPDSVGKIEEMILFGLNGSGGSLYPIMRTRTDTQDELNLIADTPIPENAWVHLSFTYQSSQWGYIWQRIYINGVKVDSVDGWLTYTDNFYIPTNNHTIGWFDYAPATDGFNGSIDEFTIFNKQLSNSEVAQMYQDGMNGIATCKPDNHAPLFTNSLNATATEDAAYSSYIYYNDIDAGDIVDLTSTVMPSWLNLNTSTGLVSGTPTNDNVGDTIVVLRITDGTVTVNKTFNISVVNTNDAPVIDSSPTTETDEDALYEYHILFHDVDVDDEVSIDVDAPTWLNLNTITNTLSGTPTNALLGTNEYVDFPVTVTATDLALATDVQSYSLRVWNVNDPPQILGQKSLETPGNTTISLNVSTVYAAEHIIDVDNVFPGDFTLTVQDGSNYTWAVNGAYIDVTPNENFRGSLAVNATLSDGQADVVTIIYISVENSVPVITSTPVTTGAVGIAYSYVITAEDADVDDELIFSGDLVPGWASFNASTHLLSGTPTNAGFYDVLLSVTDGIETVTQTFQIDVSVEALPEYNSNTLQVYPVPASNKLFVEFTEAGISSCTFEILDIGGNIILKNNLNADSNTHEIDISGFNPGIYFYRVIEDENIYTGKIIIK